MNLSEMTREQLLAMAVRTCQDMHQHEDDAEYYAQLSPDNNEEGYDEDQLYSIENEERNAASYARSCLEDELYYLGLLEGRTISITEFADNILPEYENGC